MELCAASLRARTATGFSCAIALTILSGFSASSSASAADAKILYKAVPLEPRYVFEASVYYAWSYLGGTPAYGTFVRPPAGTTINGLPVITGASYDADFAAPNQLTGYGVELSAKRILASGWFTGLSYTGFFTDDTTSVGALNATGNAVFVNLHDRSLANLILDSTFDDGEADAAKETIKVKRHQGDLVLGRQTQFSPWLGGSWQAGLRVAAIDLDRDVLYQDLSGADLLSAQVTLKSRMIGAGPTLGVAGSYDLAGTGWMIKSSASASLLLSRFKLSRRDLQTTPTRAGFRNVDMTTYAAVPMLDATIKLSKAFGNLQLGVGYRVSAALGGARTILSLGNDDVDGATSPYKIEQNDIINQGVFAKASLAFGPAN
jgi:Legionella pneumophila major outer membrane protein precursor